MPSNFAAIKAKARRDIHDGLSIAATHKAVSSGLITELAVRWHSKQVLLGDFQDGGYANFVEGIERIIFDREELFAKGVTPREGDVVTITAVGYDNVQLVLKVREQTRGPIELPWEVARL